MSADGMASYQTVHGLSFPTTVAFLKAKDKERRRKRDSSSGKKESVTERSRLQLQQSAEFSTTA